VVGLDQEQERRRGLPRCVVRNDLPHAGGRSSGRQKAADRGRVGARRIAPRRVYRQRDRHGDWRRADSDCGCRGAAPSGSLGLVRPRGAPRALCAS
jgi:hypothetical protein